MVFNFLTWAVTIITLPIVFIIYLVHRFLDLLFGTMTFIADGFEKAAELVNKLPGGMN